MTRTKLRRLGRWGLVGLLVAAGLGGGTYAVRYPAIQTLLDLPEYSHEEGGHRAVQVRMRDGVELYTQVFTPEGEGPWPTLLVRNPYDFGGTFGIVCGVFVRYGYACVHQDVRGRMRSEGEWTPLENERKDGLDTLDWLVAQPFVDGHVALFGMSYLAAVQWAVADRLPPEVKTMIPLVYGTDGYVAQWEGGLFRHEVMTAWAALMPDDGLHFERGGAYAEALRHRPHRDVDVEYFGGELPWYRTWISAETRSHPFWVREDVRFMEQQPARVKVPVLSIGGWFDIFLATQVEDFQALATRADSRMVIGPWHHLHRSDVELPDDPGIGGQMREILDWLAHHLRGAPYPRQKGVVKTYALGENAWHVRPRWPPETTPVRFFLADVAGSRDCAGGRLAAEAPGAPGEIAYRYDPLDPVPTRGGSALLAFAFFVQEGFRPGPLPQGDLCERSDVLTFRSEPLQEALHIAGRARVHLEVRSDAEDTAFTVKLLEERPDGTAVSIRQGARTLAHRAGDAKKVPYAPGTPASLTVELWPIEWRLMPGTRLRLEVSSSNFPALHAHPNLAGPWAEQAEVRVAENTLLGGAVEVPEWDEAHLSRRETGRSSPAPRGGPPRR